ncbi:MAG: 6-bladed beta-propeller, partial [Sphingobacteriales bacterium]
MKATLALILCLHALPTAVNAQRIIPIDTSDVKTLRVDPSNSFGASASEAFDSATYIPLETTKESIFGKIDKLEVTDKYFIILDENTNSILFFDRQGKFQHKIYGGGNKSMGNSDR